MRLFMTIAGILCALFGAGTCAILVDEPTVFTPLVSNIFFVGGLSAIFIGFLLMAAAVSDEEDPEQDNFQRALDEARRNRY